VKVAYARKLHIPSIAKKPVSALTTTGAGFLREAQVYEKEFSKRYRNNKARTLEVVNDDFDTDSDRGEVEANPFRRLDGQFHAVLESDNIFRQLASDITYLPGFATRTKAERKVEEVLKRKLRKDQKIEKRETKAREKERRQAAKEEKKKKGGYCLTETALGLIFDKYDRDGNGVLDRREALQALKGEELSEILGYSTLAPSGGDNFSGQRLGNIHTKSFMQVYSAIDCDNSDTIEWEEWRKAFDSLVDPDPFAGRVEEKKQEKEVKKQKDIEERIENPDLTLKFSNESLHHSKSNPNLNQRTIE